ncbi:MAG: PPC domain-containing protein [Myxococcota bacterium]|nr:PPC domain-containing protein [Myxococcota bacterium]
MRRIVSLALLSILAGCATALPSAEDVPFAKGEGADGAADASAEAVFLDFAFDGELVSDSRWSPEEQIESQLIYTMGLFNGERGVSRLDRVVLTDVRVEPVGGRYRITYSATLPVAWGRRAAIPTELTLRLPRDVSRAGLARFTERYAHTCVDIGAHDVTADSYWYYYRPAARGCSLAAEDIVAPIAGVTVSDIGTTGRFPEYDMVWSDDVLRVVAVFGKYEDGATTSSDAGIAAYNRFLREAQTLLGAGHTTIPETLARDPGVSVPDVTFRAELADGHSIEIVALLVDNVRTAGATFDARFGGLSTRADLIVYNGHAGLGANVRALAQKGRWTAGQYAIVFMNGCDTYAYVDGALWDAHSAVNADDPEGTKYMDIVMNAMPAYFSSMPRATMAMIRALMQYDAPSTYEQIFASIDRAQIVVVSGEQDNAYTPGGGGEPEPTWDGLRDAGSLARGAESRYETPALAAGRYRVTLTGTGDADLYVRIGAAPTTGTYDCRPYRSDANETCEIELAGAAPLHLMVRGYTASTFELTALAAE